jgi:biopolymer transport protein ExbD
MLVDKKKDREIVIPTSSMADIAFILLIFFLVTTTMNTDKGIPMVLPPPGQTKEVPKKNICNILVNSQGDVLLGNEPIQIPNIKTELERRMAENENLIISVKTDLKTSYDYFIAVLDQVKMTGSTRVSIAEPE